MTDRIIPQGYTRVPLDYEGEVWLESHVKDMGSEIESLRDKLAGTIGILEARNREIERIAELLTEATKVAEDAERVGLMHIEQSRMLVVSQAREAKLRAALVALDEYYSLPGEDDWVRFLNEVLTPAREVLRQTAEELK